MSGGYISENSRRAHGRDGRRISEGIGDRREAFCVTENKLELSVQLSIKCGARDICMISWA